MEVRGRSALKSEGWEIVGDKEVCVCVCVWGGGPECTMKCHVGVLTLYSSTIKASASCPPDLICSTSSL